MLAEVFDFSEERARRTVSGSLKWDDKLGSGVWSCQAGVWTFSITQNPLDRLWGMQIRREGGGVFRSLWQRWTSLGAAQAWAASTYHRGLLESYYGVPRWRLSARMMPATRAEGFNVELVRLDIDAWGFQLKDLDSGAEWFSELRYRTEGEARSAAINATKQLRETGGTQKPGDAL